MYRVDLIEILAVKSYVGVGWPAAAVENGRGFRVIARGLGERCLLFLLTCCVEVVVGDTSTSSRRSSLHSSKKSGDA